MNKLKIYNDKKSLLNELAECIILSSRKAIQVRGQFNLVLSGGNSPKQLYQLLASAKFRDRIDWDKTYFFFGDERFVDEFDPQRNSEMARETLLDPLKIANQNIFKVDTNTTPEEAAIKYLQSINTHFGDKSVQFDFVLLGLGSNSHTASLFPHTAVLNETAPTIRAVYVEEVDMFRITMSAPLINQVRQIAFLVFGKDKAEAVYHVVKEEASSASEYPARLIQQEENKVLWFLDSDSASQL